MMNGKYQALQKKFLGRFFVSDNIKQPSEICRCFHADP